MAIAGVNGETLLTALSEVAVSSGSACTSASVEPSYVLRAMGISNELAHASLRFSLGRYNDELQIETAIRHLREVISGLRRG